MRKKVTILLLLLSVFCFAQKPYLIKDINTTSRSYFPTRTVSLGSRMFTIIQGGYGAELYVTDGTVGNGTLVKDIYPGIIGALSGSQFLVVSGSKIYFKADHPVYGAELWSSDGTSAGTQLVKDIHLSGSSNPEFVTAMGGKIYFAADDDINGTELWVSDGTLAGTQMVKDIAPIGSSDVSQLVVMGGKLYFFANDGINGRELWVSDGTDAGTQMVIDYEPGPGSSNPNYLTVAGSHLYFSAANSTTGTEVVMSDGTFAGTMMVADISSGTGSSFPELFYAVGDTLYFRAFDPVYGSELFICKASPLSTLRVTDINAGPLDSYPSGFFWYNQRLYFTAESLTFGRELHVLEDTNGILVKDIFPGFSGSNPTEITLFNSKMYFTARDTIGNLEVWESDGTAVGTVLKLNLGSGIIGSSPTRYFVFGGKIYFNAKDSIGGYAWYVSDGTLAGTSPMNINIGNLGSDISELKVCNDRVYFTADNKREENYEPYTTQGKTSNTQNVWDYVYPGMTSSEPYQYLYFGGWTYFVANRPDVGFELFRTRGDSASTELVKDIYAGPIESGVYGLMAWNGKLYFAADDSAHGIELWQSDGTAAGTVLLKDILPGINGGFPREFYPYQGKLYFHAEGPDGREVWYTDGTASGTQQFVDIHPGVNSSDPEYFVEFRNKLYFTASNGTDNSIIYRTDGTLIDSIDASVNFASHLFVMDTTLFFGASSPLTGGDIELFSTDGTLAGTKFIKDINASGASSPSSFVSFQGEVYFLAEDNIHGAEIWKTNGTELGTQLLKDINAGSSSTEFQFASVLGSKMYFGGRTDSTGFELWVTDGTAVGTEQVVDQFAGGEDGLIEFVKFKNSLILSMNTPETGIELFRFDYKPELQVLRPDSVYCSEAKDTLLFNVESPGSILSGNVYQVELSDSMGNFGTPIIIGNTSSASTSGTIVITLPSTLSLGGAYRIRLRSTNIAAVSDSVSRPFSIRNCDVAVREIIESEISIYPNPAANEVQIQLPALDVESKLTVLDVNAVVMHSIRLEKGDSRNMKLDVSSYPNGIYMLNLQSSNQSRMLKMVVSH